MKEYLAPNLYLPVGSLCDYPGVHFRFLGLKMWLTAEYNSKPVFAVFITHMSDLAVLGHSTGTISMAWTVTSWELSCITWLMSKGEICAGSQPPAVVSSLWANSPGDTLNPVPFPKDFKTITQKKVMQDKSCILLPQMSQMFYKSPPHHAASLSVGSLKIWLFKRLHIWRMFDFNKQYLNRVLY